MKVVEKKVYYCDFCRPRRKHGLSRRAMELHESICTLNPDRRCRWKMDEGSPEEAAHAALSTRAIADELHDRGEIVEADVVWLREKVGGCPACMLACLRCSGLDFNVTDAGAPLFDYSAEVDRFREEERARWARDPGNW